MSTATIYAHSLGRPHDEATGVIGGSEPGVPAYWSYSVSIAVNWEQAQASAVTPGTRKVALRTAIVERGQTGHGRYQPAAARSQRFSPGLSSR